MIIQAELRRKQSEYEGESCAVDEAIYELDGYMDFEKYGQDCMENDCVTKTEFGLLRRLDPPFPEQRQGQQMFQ